MEQHSEHPEVFTEINRKTVTILERRGIANDETDAARGTFAVRTTVACKSAWCCSS